jgi:hypothetical protein
MGPSVGERNGACPLGYLDPIRSVTAVVMASFALTACSHTDDYRVEATKRCLEQQGLKVLVQGGEKPIGIFAVVSFGQPGGLVENEPGGEFLFVRKGSRVESVLRTLRQNAPTHSPPFFLLKVGQPPRNVISNWGSRADTKFKASAERCLTK